MKDTHYLIKHRRNGSSLYLCKHHTHYMKVGAWNEIEDEINLYRILKSKGFPLPDLKEFKCESDDFGWMKEEIISGKLFSELCTESYQEKGYISEEILDQIISYQKKHLFLQSKIIGEKIISREFDRYSFLFEEGKINPHVIETLFKKINNITKSLPNCRNHGDHNLYNIFTNGIIDLEDGFYGVYGYDAITTITQNYWFTDNNGELNKQHKFSNTQTKKFLQECSNELIDFTDHTVFGALFILRGIFCTVKSTETPILEDFRYQKIKGAINEFLAGSNMIDYYLKTY